MKKFTILLFCLFIFNLPNQIFSQEEIELSEVEKSDNFSPGWAIGIKASTLGFGGELVKSFSKSFNLRLGGSYFKYDVKELVFEDAEAESYVTVGAISLIADWQFISFMHLSGGILYNMTFVDINEEVDEGPQNFGTINYSIKPNEICPYFGIGFGRTISKNKVVSFNFDLGLVYQGSPKFTIETTGTILDDYLKDQEEMIEDAMRNYRFFPFVNFQLSFRIF